MDKKRDRGEEGDSSTLMIFTFMSRRSRGRRVGRHAGADGSRTHVAARRRATHRVRRAHEHWRRRTNPAGRDEGSGRRGARHLTAEEPG